MMQFKKPTPNKQKNQQPQTNPKALHSKFSLASGENSIGGNQQIGKGDITTVKGQAAIFSPQSEQKYPICRLELQRDRIATRILSNCHRVHTKIYRTM